jgi:hypothetical protein
MMLGKGVCAVFWKDGEVKGGALQMHRRGS